MTNLFKTAAAMAAASMALAPVIAQAQTRPTTVTLAKAANSRLGMPAASFNRAGAVQGESDSIVLGLLPILGVIAGVAATVFVVTEVTGDSSPS